MSDFYIACVDRTRVNDLIVWWRPNERGYTTNLDEAGKYSRQDMERICRPEIGIVEHVAFSAAIVQPGEMRVVDRDRSLFFDELRRAEHEAACRIDGTFKR